ncbi:MAG: recombinase zinc beta ribbon domain-containing protein [Pseudomonadota bacterium]
MARYQAYLEDEALGARRKLLVRDEPIASILQEALEGYASGRFETQVEVKRFLEAQPAFPKCLPNGEIRNQRIHDYLTRSVYTGHVEAPKWKVSLRKGHHEPLISYETHLRIQERLRGTAKAPARKDISADFPLRGFITCDDCNTPLTACWSKSKTGKKHPYYLCPTKGCPSYRKSIRRDTLEGAFETLLRKLQPSQNLFRLAKVMLADAWDMQRAKSGETRKQLQSDLKRVEKEIDKLLDRIVESNQPTMIGAYEKRIGKLESEKVLLAEKLEKTGQPTHTLEELFELALTFLANPWKIWASGGLALKRSVLRLAFCERIAYSRESGFRTPQIAFPFRALGMNETGLCEMAHRGCVGVKLTHLVSY